MTLTPRKGRTDLVHHARAGEYIIRNNHNNKQLLAVLFCCNQGFVGESCPQVVMMLSAARRIARPVSRTAARSVARAFSTKEDLSPGDNVVVPLIANSLEFTLSKPPPLHQFVESPIVVETEHLDMHPGKEAEEVLSMQGEEVTDVVGKEGWTFNDPAKYEGLIPQNPEWTEFVDEKTGEWVYLDEYGNRVEKPVEL